MQCIIIVLITLSNGLNNMFGTYINTQHTFSIWFSNNPLIWLPLLNQERIKQLRKINPNLNITLLIDPSLLNKYAMEACEKFSNKYRMQIVSVRDVEKLVYEQGTDEDKVLFGYALDDIHMKRYAAARDILTLLPQVYRYGFYKDHECPVKIDELPEWVQLSENDEPAVLIPLHIVQSLDETFYTPSPLNDIIIPTVYLDDASIDGLIVQEDRIRTGLSSIREHVLNCYSDKCLALSECMDKSHPLFGQAALAAYQSDVSWPRFIEDLLKQINHDYSSDFLQIKKDSVVKISGPGAFYKLFAKSSKLTAEEIKQCSLYGINTYPVLRTKIVSQAAGTEPIISFAAYFSVLFGGFCKQSRQISQDVFGEYASLNGYDASWGSCSSFSEANNTIAALRIQAWWKRKKGIAFINPKKPLFMSFSEMFDECEEIRRQFNL